MRMLEMYKKKKNKNEISDKSIEIYS